MVTSKEDLSEPLTTPPPPPPLEATPTASAITKSSSSSSGPEISLETESTTTETRSPRQISPTTNPQQQQQQLQKVHHQPAVVIPPKKVNNDNDDIQSLLSSWRLTPEARSEIFDSVILPTLQISPPPPLSSSSSSAGTPHRGGGGGGRRRRPLAIILLGQTGSGKTSLAPQLLSHFPSSSSSTPSSLLPPLHFIADTLKTYHPNFRACPARHASRLASDDARYWLKRACLEAARHGRDLLLESACRHPDDFVTLAQILSTGTSTSTSTSASGGSHHGSGSGGGGDRDGAGGYVVRVVCLAVAEGVSRLGCLVRYHRKLPEAGGKWGLGSRRTPPAIHRASFVGALEGLKWVDEQMEKGSGGSGNGSGRGSGVVDRVAVVRRGGKLAYREDARDYYSGGREKEGEGEEEEEEQEGNAKGGMVKPRRLRASQVLEMERRRKLSQSEWEKVKEDLEYLKEVGDEEVEEVERMISGLLPLETKVNEEEREEQDVWSELEDFDVEEFVRGGLE